MSSSAIRSAVRSMPDDAAWPAGLPFFESIGTDPDPASMGDIWCTLAFEPDSDAAICIGGAVYRERGTVRVVILARSGRGDAAAISAAESVRSYLRGSSLWPAPTVVEEIGQPTTVDPGGEGNWLRVDVAATYHRDHT